MSKDFGKLSKDFGKIYQEIGQICSSVDSTWTFREFQNRIIGVMDKHGNPHGFMAYIETPDAIAFRNGEPRWDIPIGLTVMHGKVNVEDHIIKM